MHPDDATTVLPVPADQTDQPTVRLPASGGPAGEPGDRPADDVQPTGVAPTPPGGRRPAVVAAAAGGAVLLVLLLVYLVDLVTTSGELERGTSIAGVEVGGLTPEEATQALETGVGPSYREPVSVDAHGVPVALDPAAAGLTPDIAGAVRLAGERSANPFVRLGSFFRSEELPLAVAVDEPALRTFVGATATATDVAPVEGEVTLDGVAVRTVAPVVGKALDVDGSVGAITAAWTAGGPRSLAGLPLPVEDLPVRASAERTAAAAAEAELVLSGPLTLQADQTPVQVPVEAIAAATTVTPDAADGFTVAVDAAALRGGVEAAVLATETQPADATIQIVADQPTITASVTGRTVDWPATLAAVDPAVRSPERVAAVAYTLAEPALTTARAESLGIREVIGEFETGGFASSSGENIRVVAEAVDGAIVQPGATFGLNEFTGPRGVEQGYVEAAIIQEGALARAVGGGISQFATTLYNAAYFAGMGDVTHTPHSFYISRYPAGREATVFDGEIELAFSNDYDTAVLIQTVWTDETITVRLWGTKQVQVESISSERFDFTNPERIVKPYGTECSPSGGSTGFSIVDTRVLRDLGGAEIRREDFTTVYNGQQNVVCSSAPVAPAETTTAESAVAEDPAASAPAAEPAPAAEAAPGG